MIFQMKDLHGWMAEKGPAQVIKKILNYAQLQQHIQQQYAIIVLSTRNKGNVEIPLKWSGADVASWCIFLIFIVSRFNGQELAPSPKKYRGVVSGSQSLISRHFCINQNLQRLLMTDWYCYQIIFQIYANIYIKAK